MQDYVASNVWVFWTAWALGLGVIGAIGLTLLLPETMGQELDHVEAER